MKEITLIAHGLTKHCQSGTPCPFNGGKDCPIKDKLRASGLNDCWYASDNMWEDVLIEAVKKSITMDSAPDRPTY